MVVWNQVSIRGRSNGTGFRNFNRAFFNIPDRIDPAVQDKDHRAKSGSIPFICGVVVLTIAGFVVGLQFEGKPIPTGWSLAIVKEALTAPRIADVYGQSHWHWTDSTGCGIDHL
jgi:hypothetical protein